MTATATPLHSALGVFFLPPTHEYCGRSHTGIVFAIGARWVHAVAFYAEIKFVEIARDVVLVPVLLAGAAYPVARAAQRMLDSLLPCGANVRAALLKLVAGETVEAIDD